MVSIAFEIEYLMKKEIKRWNLLVIIKKRIKEDYWKKILVGL